MSQRHVRGNKCRVVVTGLGVVSPYGRGCQVYWQGLAQGQCVLGPLSLFPTDGFRSCIAGEVSAATVQALGTTHPSRATRLLLAAADEGVRSAGLGPAELTTAAVSIGGAGGGMLEAEDWYWARYHHPQDTPKPVALRSMLPANQTDALACHLRIGGPRESPVLACSSSAAAIATVADLIEAGVVDVGLAGGVDTLTRLCFMGFNALKLLDPQLLLTSIPTGRGRCRMTALKRSR